MVFHVREVFFEREREREGERERERGREGERTGGEVFLSTFPNCPSSEYFQTFYKRQIQIQIKPYQIKIKDKIQKLISNNANLRFPTVHIKILSDTFFFCFLFSHTHFRF